MANELYRMYDEMLKGYKEKNDGLFEHGVRCWMDLNPENPFPEDSDAYDIFYRMQSYYKVWRIGSADYKVNRVRMLNAAKELCAAYPKRPYKFDRKADAEDKAAKAAAEEERVRLQKEQEAKEIMEEAERIVQAELKAKEESDRKEKARLEWEKAEAEAAAEAKAEEERKAKLLQKAIEEKRNKIKMEQPTHVLGIIPETGVLQETVKVEEKEKESFFKRIFGRKAKKHDSDPAD